MIDHVLRLGLHRAAGQGIFAARVPGNRTILVVDLIGCQSQGWSVPEFNERLARQTAAARRRARFDGGNEWIIHSTSLDSVSRDPLRVPFAAYPLHPVACARLIGDIACFVVETSGPALAEALGAAGLAARWVRPPGTGEAVMEITSTTHTQVGDLIRQATRTLQVQRSELDRYLTELIQQRTWAEGIKLMMADPELAKQPWTYYRDEHDVWARRRAPPSGP
jgi:hypothetical protein